MRARIYVCALAAMTASIPMLASPAGAGTTTDRSARPLTLAVIGDVPYGTEQEASFHELVDAGPAAAHRLMKTVADPTGRRVLGTVNNCAHGSTPWGTYLTCEENFNGYFRLDPGAYTTEQAALQSRYGVGGDRNNWTTHDDRWVVTPAEPNEPNRFGWVVEIDPMDPTSTPVKRTALGRTKHEGAFVHVTKGGRVRRRWTGPSGRRSTPTPGSST